MGNLKNGGFLGKTVYYESKKSRIMLSELYTFNST